MSDDKIIQEAVRLVDEGLSVVMAVNGHSMLPFIVGGRDSVQLEKADGTDIGDVVLAWVRPGRYVIHRIIRIDGDEVTLMGDGNLAGTESCRRDDIKAWATAVVTPDERRHSLCSRRMRCLARLWRWLLPIRRYLLYVRKLKN